MQVKRRCWRLTDRQRDRHRLKLPSHYVGRALINDVWLGRLQLASFGPQLVHSYWNVQMT